LQGLVGESRSFGLFGDKESRVRAAGPLQQLALFRAELQPCCHRMDVRECRQQQPDALHQVCSSEGPTCAESVPVMLREGHGGVEFRRVTSLTRARHNPATV